MKRKLYGGLLAAELLACLAGALLKSSLVGVFSAALAFPFEQIGLGLRAFSLSGGAGNAAASVLYALLSLSPCALLWLLHRRRALQAEDGLLVLLSGTLFAVLYLMVNPALAAELLGGGEGAGLPLAKAILGCAVYSLLCAYLVLRLLRLFFVGGREALQKYLLLLLALLNALFVYRVFGAGASGLLDAIGTLRAGNTDAAVQLGASYVFLGLRALVDALPYVLDIFVVFAGMRLLRELAENRYGEGAVLAAERLAKLCAWTLGATVLSHAAFNLLQLLFAKALRVVNSSVQLPLFSIAFVLTALLLARLVAENKALKDDNDSII